MAGVRIEVKSDDAALQASFKRLTATLDDLRPVMDRIGQSLVTSVIDRFERVLDALVRAGHGAGHLQLCDQLTWRQIKLFWREAERRRTTEAADLATALCVTLVGGDANTEAAG